MHESHTTFQIGQIKITQLVELYPWEFPARGWFPELTPEQAAVAAEHYPAAVVDDTTWVVALRNYVVELGGKVIVVDTCAGNHKTRPNMSELHQLGTDYLERFVRAGFDPERVDIVVNTHLHPDHCGWNTRLADGAWLPSFPNAVHLFDRAELEFARTVGPSGLLGALSEDVGNMYEDSVLPILEQAEHELIEAGEEILSFGAARVATLATPGHTPGHLAVEARDGGDGVILSGDVLHHPVQARYPDLRFVGDADPEQAVRTRRELLARCADEGLRLLTAHVATRPGSALQAPLGVVRDEADGGFDWVV
ncbi:MAG: MBL fold metallo-hydrolase [Segniliparus sp.]|uniref:MBL fold metallo-hydrolase n=1 Tax=Segniliparus sp. TaxID=2804064 RepID=UPI003F3947F8